MPYIEEQAREYLTKIGDVPAARTCGELNYLITKLSLNYLKANGLKYQTLNDVLGALHCASEEMYRRVAAGYEDSKISANGDVYGTFLNDL